MGSGQNTLSNTSHPYVQGATDPGGSEASEGGPIQTKAHATTDGVRDPERSFGWRTSGTAIRETAEKGDEEMAATTATPSRSTTRAFPLRYFVLAFAFTWFFWGLGVLSERGIIPTLPGFTVIGTFGPMVAAVILTAREGGRAEVRSLLGRIVRWRVAPVWYGVAILGPFVLTLVAIALHVALGGQIPNLGSLIGALPTVIFVSLYMLIFVALGEEVGWRGYALPALQARHGAFLASVILGAVWALWHVPQFFNPATLYSDLPFVLFLAYLIPFSVLITWVFNSAGGCVLMAMLVHAIMNASTQVWRVLPEYSGGPGVMSAAEAAAATVHANLILTVVLWVAAVAVVLVYGARNLSRKPRQVLADAVEESQQRVQ
jgi:membrane protease YdiL (CAAX protease family)